MQSSKVPIDRLAIILITCVGFCQVAKCIIICSPFDEVQPYGNRWPSKHALSNYAVHQDESNHHVTLLEVTILQLLPTPKGGVIQWRCSTKTLRPGKGVHDRCILLICLTEWGMVRCPRLGEFMLSNVN